MMMKLTKPLPKNLPYLLIMIAKVKDCLEELKIKFWDLARKVHNPKELVCLQRMIVQVSLQEKKIKFQNLRMNNSSPK